VADGLGAGLVLHMLFFGLPSYMRMARNGSHTLLCSLALWVLDCLNNWQVVGSYSEMWWQPLDGGLVTKT